MENKKIKIKYKQTYISDEEILEFKDFDGLLESHKKLSTSRNKNIYLITFLIIFSGTILFYTINFKSKIFSDLGNHGKINNISLTEEENKNTPSPLLNSPEKVLDSTEISVKEEIALKEEVNDNKENENKTSENHEIPKQRKSFDKNAEVDTINVQEEKQINVSEYEYIDARPVDGYTALFEYFKEETIYPEQAKNEELEGTVILEFTVMDTGEIKKVKIINGVSPDIDEEAIRLITHMPKWIPATINGQKVKSRLSIPLNFQLERTTE